MRRYRLIAAAHGKAKEPRSRQHLQSYELGEPETFTAKEIEVAQLYADGLTTREIAVKLWVTVETVKAHTRTMRARAGQHTTLGTVVFMLRGGLIR